MFNQVVLVGRLTQEINEENIFKIKVENSDQTYFNIPISVTNSLRERMLTTTRKNDVIGIKGRLRYTDKGRLIVDAEKVTFLSSSSNLNL